MDPIQSNIKQGDITINAGEDLTSKEGYLVKLGDAGSVPEVLIPTAASDLTLYQVVTGSTHDTDCEVHPLVAGEQRRFIATGNGSAGTVLICDASAYGKVKALGANGTYFSPGIAEEDWVAGQYVKARVFPRVDAFTV